MTYFYIAVSITGTLAKHGRLVSSVYTKESRQNSTLSVFSYSVMSRTIQHERSWKSGGRWLHVSWRKHVTSAHGERIGQASFHIPRCLSVVERILFSKGEFVKATITWLRSRTRPSMSNRRQRVNYMSKFLLDDWI